MPEIASIVDLRGQQLYTDYNTRFITRRCTGWYVANHYVGTSAANMFYVKKCSSRQAAINWATSKKRIKEFGENAKFYITHA